MPVESSTIKFRDLSFGAPQEEDNQSKEPRQGTAQSRGLNLHNHLHDHIYLTSHGGRDEFHEQKEKKELGEAKGSSLVEQTVVNSGGNYASSQSQLESSGIVSVVQLSIFYS